MSEDAPKFDFSVLRQLRKGRGMTIDEVSKASGVSLAVISKLERNQTAAEIETLFKVSRIFGMSASDLLALAESPFAHREFECSYNSHGFKFRRIRYGNVMVLLGDAEAGAMASRPEIHHDDYEVCWVLSGRLRLTLPNETTELSAGESLQFDAILEHRYEAIDDAKLIILHIRKEKRF